MMEEGSIIAGQVTKTIVRIGRTIEPQPIPVSASIQKSEENVVREYFDDCFEEENTKTRFLAKTNT